MTAWMRPARCGRTRDCGAGGVAPSSTGAPPTVLMAEMQAQATSSSGDAVDGTNYVVIAGQPIVIDFCTVTLNQRR